MLRYDLGRQLILADRLQNSSRRLGMRWLDGWSETACAVEITAQAWFTQYGAALVIADFARGERPC